MSRVEPISFFSEGQRIAADLYLPDAAGATAPVPAVVLCHGYTGVRHLYLPDTARFLNRAGYAAIAFDFKGWGDSEGPRQRLDPYGRVADTQAALTYLAERPEVDASRIGLFGWSFGCSVGVWLAAIDDRIKALVGVVGVANGGRWLAAVRSGEEWEALRELSSADRVRRMRTGESEFVDRPTILYLDPKSQKLSSDSRQKVKGAAERIPLEFVDETLGFNPEWVVDKIAPRAAMFIGCEEDVVVPPSEMQALYDRAGEPKRLEILEGYGHYDVYFGTSFEKVMELTVDWLSQHI